jgi:hypothetical protein
VKKRKRKKSKQDIGLSESIEQDEHFYFIAGYTEGGAPYGLTWEECEVDESYISNNKMNEEELLMKELKLTESQLQELVDTYDMHFDELECFLNIDTGDIVMLNEFDKDEEYEELSETIEEGFNEIYFRIPSTESHEGYRDMEDFAETVSNEKLKARLFNALSSGRKVFRKFKDTLSSDDRELERYYRYVESRNRRRVMEWLESINISLTLMEK